MENENQELTPETEKPTGVPTSFVEHATLNNDLLTVALQADVTRVATLLYAKEASTRSYPELGFADAHHPLTHHRGRAELIEKATKIECHHMEQFAYLVQKLKSIQEGDGTLLDHSMVVYGSSMSDPNQHLHYNLPCVRAGPRRRQSKARPAHCLSEQRYAPDQPLADAAGSDGRAGRKTR